MIVNWVIGDTFKMWFFFASAKGEVPWAFKACGVFQATCDLGLAMQYLVWGDGPVEKVSTSPVPLSEGLEMEGGKVLGDKGIEMQEGRVWERPRVS